MFFFNEIIVFSFHTDPFGLTNHNQLRSRLTLHVVSCSRYIVKATYRDIFIRLSQEIRVFVNTRDVQQWSEPDFSIRRTWVPHLFYWSRSLSRKGLLRRRRSLRDHGFLDFRVLISVIFAETSTIWGQIQLLLGIESLIDLPVLVVNPTLSELHEGTNCRARGKG